MNLEINNKSELYKIKALLNTPAIEISHCSTDNFLYKEVRKIVDIKIDLIAHEMHLIMNDGNHSHNFMQSTEAWEEYRDYVVNGATIFHELLEQQVYLLACKVSSELNDNYLKAINYFYGDIDMFTGSSSETMFLHDILDSKIDINALSEFERVLFTIAEKEEECLYNMQQENEELEEYKEYINELYEEIKELTKKQGVAEDISIITEYQKDKVNFFDELVEMKELEEFPLRDVTQLLKLKKQREFEFSKLKELE